MEPDGIDLVNQNGTDDVAAEVKLARETLQSARSALDVVVAAMPDIDRDEAMATPALLSLLLGAVRAKEHLNQLEALLAGKLAQA